MDYLMPKPSLEKDSIDINQPIAEGNKGVNAFPKGISLEVNVIMQVVFEFAYFEVTV